MIMIINFISNIYAVKIFTKITDVNHIILHESRKAFLKKKIVSRVALHGKCTWH